MVEKKEICQELPKLKGLGNSPASAYIFGDVEDDMILEVALPLLEYATGDEPIEIYVTTDGGDPQVALVLADIIERLEVPTTLVLLGTVASSGVLIALSGVKNPHVHTVALPSTRMMWHSGYLDSGEGCYPMHLLQDRLDYEAVNRDRMVDYIVDRCRLTREQLDEYERQEKWFFAEELLELGIVDEIL